MKKDDLENRRHERHRLLPNFGYISNDQGKECICMLRDISRSGASAEVMQNQNFDPPRVGMKIHLEDFPETLNALVADRNATVVWSCGNRMGIQFNRLIPLENGSRPMG